MNSFSRSCAINGKAFEGVVQLIKEIEIVNRNRWPAGLDDWDYKYTQDNSGLEGAVTWQATPNLGLEAFVSNEISAASTTAISQLPGTDETLFGLRVNITGNPVTFGKKDYKKNLFAQMTQPVKRKYDVLLERYAISTESSSSETSFTSKVGGN